MRVNLKTFAVIYGLFIVSLLGGCTGSGESSQGSGDYSTVNSISNAYNLDDGAYIVVNTPVAASDEGESTEFTEDDPECSVESREAGNC